MRNTCEYTSLHLSRHRHCVLLQLHPLQVGMTSPNCWGSHWRSITACGKTWTSETSWAWVRSYGRRLQISQSKLFKLFCIVLLFLCPLIFLGFVRSKGFPSNFVSTSVWSESDLQVFGDSLIPPAAESDLLRLYLLNKYGGVWVDSTNLCRRPLNDWLPSAASQGFFAFFPDLQSPEHKGVPHIISSAFALSVFSMIFSCCFLHVFLVQQYCIYYRIL